MLNSLLVLFLCGIIVAYAERKYVRVCTTTICKQTAHRILENMDSSVDPCTDFYEYACGNFVKKTVIPKELGQYDSFSKVEASVGKQLQKLFSTKSGLNESKNEKNLKRYYDLCMDEAKINARGVNPALDVLKKSGGWPVLQKYWKGENWNYIDTEVWLNTYVTTTGLLESGVSPDPEDPNKHIIWLDQASVSPGREYLVEGFGNKDVNDYQDFLVDLAIALGADNQTAIKEQKQTLKFIINLAKGKFCNSAFGPTLDHPFRLILNERILYSTIKAFSATITTKSEDRRYLSNAARMSLAELKERWGWLDWERLLNGLMPRGMTPLTDTDEVIVAEPSYFTKLGPLLRRVPTRTVANYMMGRAAVSMGKHLPKFVEQVFDRYDSNTIGVQNTPRRKRCLDEVAGFKTFNVALSSLYVKKYFNNKSKEEASAIGSLLKQEMLKVIQEVTWMDNKTKTLAKEKASKMLHFIGYPPELLDDNPLESYDKSLRMNESQFLEAHLDIKREERAESWRQLREPVSPRSDWRKHASLTVVGASYIGSYNTIDFPAAILQSPFFNNKLPQYLNLAAIGTVFGHEITHGFDDQGRRFGAEGGLVNWWDDESLEKFTNAKQCLIDQYSSFNDTKQTLLKLNGINLQGEAIADNGGLKLAYRAYKNLEGHQQPSLPGLENYTKDKTFFLTYANMWCAKTRKETQKTKILLDSHPPMEFRVKGPLQNFEPFSKAFSCSVGSEMNPEKKCNVW